MAPTKSSKQNMKTENAIEIGAKPHPAVALIAPKMKIMEITLRIIICPARMFAKRRIVKAIGLMNNDIISMITNRIFARNGTPGGLNKCPQKCLFEVNKITINATKAKAPVTAILPVKLAPEGIRPSKLFIQIKKKKSKLVY